MEHLRIECDGAQYQFVFQPAMTYMQHDMEGIKYQMEGPAIFSRFVQLGLFGGGQMRRGLGTLVCRCRSRDQGDRCMKKGGRPYCVMPCAIFP